MTRSLTFVTTDPIVINGGDDSEEFLDQLATALPLLAKYTGEQLEEVTREGTTLTIQFHQENDDKESTT